MSEENQINLDTLDLTSTDTGFPILPAGLYEVAVTEMKFEPNKKGTGQNLKIKLALTNPTTDTSGKSINAGFPVNDLISLVISKNDDGSIKYDPRKRLAEFQEGVLGHKLPAFNPIEQYLGQTCSVRLKVEDDAEYGKSNKVQRYVKKA